MALVSSKKGGPYTKKQRIDRRNEVLRLHFEYGYPASKIAELMKINRNTISADISYGYSEFGKEWRNYDNDSLIMKQIRRLDSQRTRLLEELKIQENFKEKLAIEKMLFVIDSKITHIIITSDRQSEVIHTTVTHELNEWFKKHKMNTRFVPQTELKYTTKERRDVIRDIIDEKNLDSVKKKIEELEITEKKNTPNFPLR